MAVGVKTPTMVKLPDGTLLSVGGLSPANVPADAIQTYDAESQTWSLRAEKMIVGKAGANILVPDDWCNPNDV